MNTESLAALFKTLSEPVRLRITHLLLRAGELCVCDLVERAGAVPKCGVMSRHLTYLRNNRLASTRRVRGGGSLPQRGELLLAAV